MEPSGLGCCLVLSGPGKQPHRIPFFLMDENSLFLFCYDIGCQWQDFHPNFIMVNVSYL